jgi:uncharacterized protein (DUF488 family)
MPHPVFTIGHSTHTVEQFVGLLQQHGVSAVGDVRSMPYSRLNPHFNREEMDRFLRGCGIAYVFLGKELGARSQDQSCYQQGRIRYDLLARTDLFQRGLNRVCEGIEKYRLALMCAEKEPLECHRTILVSRHLAARGLEVRHILPDGSIEPHVETLRRLAHLLKMPDMHLFLSAEELVAEAYLRQEDRIAYEPETGDPQAFRGAAG